MLSLKSNNVYRTLKRKVYMTKASFLEPLMWYH